jgi:hypothetical protein
LNFESINTDSTDLVSLPCLLLANYVLASA